jgi:hypothetical protein
MPMGFRSIGAILQQGIWVATSRGVRRVGEEPEPAAEFGSIDGAGGVRPEDGCL